MPEGGYLKERLSLYLPFAAGLLFLTAVLLLLPYETVYVRDRAYLAMFLVSVAICVAVFLIGTLFNALLWMRGKGLVGTPEGRLLRVLGLSIRVMLTRRFWSTRGRFVKEAIYLSRLKERSATRWLMHLLILGGFAAMFLLDLVVTFSLDFLRYGPMIDESGWAKLWLRDFGFDLTGAMILLGLMIAAVRRFIVRPKIVRTELPDAASILFLLAIVLGGFLLEALGIAGSISGHEINQQYSFLGYALSMAMPSSWGAYYDQVWLVHGVMSALFIAYIPFSKLFHMFATPLAIELEHLLPREARM
ncbi:MAG: respiratory nitrate reductase subunit gamma [Thermoplasmata archaeon]